MNPTLSIIVITKNEERDLPRCLRSVWFADEIIVVDSGSSDRTVDIASEYTDKVFSYTDWQGFGTQKNRALSHATGDWVLSLDADEWLTAELCQEIRSVISHPDQSIYEFPRLSSFCGSVIRHGGWYPDYVARLFKRGSTSFSDDLVHERLLYHPDELGRLKSPLRHASYDNINEVVGKLARYASDGADNRFKNGERTSFLKVLLSSFWAFLRTWVLRLGILDGKAGFMIAVASAESTYYRHLRLLELHQEAAPQTVALVITTYNQPEVLERVLESVELLERLPDEVVIADDGSGDDTKEMLVKWSRRLPLKHIWQPDEGFRAAAIRNRAVEATQSEYLIFLDGDCLVDPEFVTRHISLAEHNCFIPGSRVLLSRSITERVISGGNYIIKWSIFRWALAVLSRGANRIIPFINLPNGNWRKWRVASWRGVRTCNLGLWRANFETVNGFDEAFSGWGYEDADLAIRLIRNGAERKDGGFGNPVLHLWHFSNRNGREDSNYRMLQESIKGNRPVEANT